MNDPKHCGNCETQCKLDEYCAKGKCESISSCTQDKCEGWCGDFKTDKDHCGNCETACDPDEYCSDGGCQKLDTCTQDKCEGWCGDFKSDPKHCGNCETDCTKIETSTGVCKQGQCESNVISCKDETDGDGNVTLHRKLCVIGGKSVCTDIDNDPNNCGECGEQCDPGETCSLGECTTTASCVLPSFVCQVTIDDESGHPVEKEVCVNPQSLNTCGISTCEEFNSLKDNNSLFACKDGFSCTLVNNQYACSCPSNIVHDGKCIDPSSNLSCGAGQNDIQEEGMVCPSGTNCVAYQDDDLTTKYHCSCASEWQLSCYHESDAGVDCINPARDDYLCSAKDCGDTSHQCASDRQCSDGLCVCKEQYVTCDGHCIDPLTDNTYCGAKGNCLDDDNIDNSAGTKCKENEVCNNGRCECNVDSISCNGECLTMGTDKVCNITVDESGCKITDCTKVNRVCKLNIGEGKYFCDCPNNTVNCGDECIEPNTNSFHCGAKGLCNNASKDSSHYKGEDCTVNTNGKTVCVNGECTSKCARGQANCNGTCVNMNDYKINEYCNDCNLDYCYTGEKDENGNIINFDYKKCLVVDENGKELNKLYSENYCGKTCETAVVCKSGMICNSVAMCACDMWDQLLCTQYKTDDPNAETKCVSKAETHQTACGVCEEGWIDCDGDLWNGCETDLKTTTNHCGSCDNDCHKVIQNATGVACVDGQCTYAYCKENWGDCDNIQNGCEQSGLMNAPNHCGQCNNVCPYGGCNHSVCCAIDGKESPHSSDLICCDGLKKYQYNHKGWWIFGSCPNDDHFGCYANNPDANCWSEVE